MMVLLSFSEESFVRKILDGTKVHTLRPYTLFRYSQFLKYPKIDLWYKSRSPRGYKIAMAQTCDVNMASVNTHGVSLYGDGTDYTFLGSWRADRFAQEDGFDDFDEMYRWFFGRYGPETDGKPLVAIWWRDVVSARQVA